MTPDHVHYRRCEWAEHGGTSRISISIVDAIEQSRYCRMTSKNLSYFWQTLNSLMPRDYDYFVFIPGSDPELAGPQVRVIFHDKDVGITVFLGVRPSLCHASLVRGHHQGE